MGKMRKGFKGEVRQWTKGMSTPDKMLKEVEKKMNDLLSLPPSQYDQQLEKELQAEHRRALLMQEHYWHQRSRVKWALFGDSNSRFFHASAVVRKRRNTVKSLQLPNGDWVTDEKEIRKAFVDHFKSIYRGQIRPNIQQVVKPQVLQSLPQIPEFLHGTLYEIPSEEEIRLTVMALGPHKAAGPDGFNAHIVQNNLEDFGPPIINEVIQFFTTGVMKPHHARSNIILIPKT